MRLETKTLNRAVKRMRLRFPEDFMLQLSSEEIQSMRYQIGTASSSKRNVRFRPYVFTEHGAAMLASVLNSLQAIAASLQIVRAFVRLRTILAEHKELAAKIEALEKKMDGKFVEQDEKILSILKIIKQFIEAPAPQKKQIGYVSAKENG